MAGEDDAGSLAEEVASLRKAIHIINTLTKELDIHAAMESVRHVALELLECERVTLFLINESRQELRGNTGPADEGRTITVKFGEGIAGVVAQNGGLMNIPDAYSHPLFNADVDRTTHFTTRNILCTAIKDMSGHNIAVVQALNKLSGGFTKVDEQHLQLFGVHLGNTLSKSRFYEEANREKERLVTLSKCFKQLNTVTSLSGALDTIAGAVKQLVCAEHVVVLLMDHARQVLWTRVTNRHTHGQAKLIRVQQREGLIGSCAADKKQLVLCCKVRVAYDIFMLSGVLDELRIPESELTGFLSAVSAHYHSPEDVPYHNLSHVVQVLHAVWLLLESTNARAVLSPEEELVLLIAAICHDLDHDGYTNSFHIYSQSALAQQYNDKSVQENHHCALTFAVLSKRGSNLFCRFTSQAEFFAARKLLIDAILGTDMHHHFALTQELLSHNTVFQAEEDADRTLLVKALLHAADISNHVRPFGLALAHAERIQQEFQRQVARERKLGLPVSPHMDASEQSVWYKMEVQFIDYVAGPLWERLGQIFPTLQEPLQNLRTNRSKFAALAQSSLGEASVGACPREPSAPSTGISSRSSFSDMASCAEAVTAAQPPAPDQQQQ